MYIACFRDGHFAHAKENLNLRATAIIDIFCVCSKPLFCLVQPKYQKQKHECTPCAT